MNNYSPFDNDPDELTELRQQNTLLHTELSSALQYIQGLHEALSEHFDGRNLSIMSQAERDLFDVWKLTSSKYPKRPDLIRLLWDAHDHLNRRFGIPSIQPVTALHLLIEECKELHAAVTAEIGGNTFDEHVTAEAADLVTVTLAVMGALGIERERFYEACRLVARKNDAKTTDTHYLDADTGKITRKG